MSHNKKKVLFICKKNESYAAYGKRSGLFNSTRFVAEGISDEHVEAKVVEVVDNNCIDREVFQYQPDIVIIEALWVVPEKFSVLMKLHPHVRWVVHLHSNIPFLATEGIAMQWIRGCAELGVEVVCNSDEAYEGLRVLLDGYHHNLHLLHNIYLGTQQKPHGRSDKEYVDVGCFGALRPMKNQLIQALAAIRFAEEEDLIIRFHINSTRLEGGDPVLKNLRALFSDSIDQLVEVPWLDHDAFMAYLNSMDIALQVSLSETFNIVSADCVTAGLPIVTSAEVDWVTNKCKARTDSVNDIANKMSAVYGSKMTIKLNQYNLRVATRKAIKEWEEFVHEF